MNNKFGRENLNSHELRSTPLDKTENTTTKSEAFVSHIKKWVLVDLQIKTLNEKIKQLRDIKHHLTNHICKYTEEHRINPTIEISDGELRIYEKKEYSALTYSYLEECLNKIIPDREHVDYILQYVKDNREHETSYDIKRIQKK
jgi:hypothetical protein